jgi:hypothetical protein
VRTKRRPKPKFKVNPKLAEWAWRQHMRLVKEAKREAKNYERDTR